MDTLDRFFRLEKHPIFRYIAGLLCPSAAISLVTLPVMALFFGYAPLAAPLTNMLILPFMPILLSCGLLAGIFAFKPAGWICQQLLAWIQTVAKWGLKGPVLPLRSQLFLLGMACCGLLVLTVFLFRGKLVSRTAAGLLSVLILGWSSFLGHVSQRGMVSVLQVPGSEGSSIVLQSGSQAVLIGCGSTGYEGRVLVDRLLSMGITELSAVIIPADKLCYTGGAYSVLTALGAEKVIAPESSRVSQALDFAEISAVFPLTSSRWSLFGEGELSIHTGGKQAVLFADFYGKRICFDYEQDPIPYPADFYFFCDKKQEASNTTRENYAIISA